MRANSLCVVDVKQPWLSTLATVVSHAEQIPGYPCLLQKEEEEEEEEEEVRVGWKL